MALEVAQLKATLDADVSGFKRAMSSVAVDTDKTTKGIKGHFGAIAQAGAAAGGLLALKFGKDAVGAFIEAEKVAAQTNAVIKSTGGVAGITAKHVDKLAGALSKKSGVDDEAIASGQNMLLTFTKIRNETGAGNKVFDQATAATLDLSVAMGKDMQSSAIMVGKALNDPIKGVTALGRAGVQFTDSQKETIEAMVKSGDTMGAQKIILKELETQFGGSAKAAGDTFGGQLGKLKVALGNVQEEVGARLVPIITALARAFVNVTEWTKNHRTETKILGGIVATVVAGFGLYKAAMIANTVATGAWTAATTIASGATKAWAAAQWLLNVALTANPIGIVVVGLTALGVGLVVAYKKSETFRDIVNGALRAVRDVAIQAFDVIAGALTTVMRAMAGFAGAIGKAPGMGWARDLAAGINHGADEVDALREKLRQIPNRINMHVNVTLGGDKIPVGPEHTLTPRPQKRATGGVVGAMERLTMVGERGPEIVSLPGGSRVYPHGTGPSGGGMVQNNYITIHAVDGQEAAEALHLELLKLQRRSGSLGFA